MLASKPSLHAVVDGNSVFCVDFNLILICECCEEVTVIIFVILLLSFR